MLLLNLDRVCSLRKFLVFSLISSGWALSAMAQQQADPRQIDQQQPTARRNQGEAPQSGQAAQPGQYRLVDAATAVAQGDAQVAQPPFPALSILSPRNGLITVSKKPAPKRSSAILWEYQPRL